jgi:hypothetical protein
MLRRAFIKLIRSLDKWKKILLKAIFISMSNSAKKGGRVRRLARCTFSPSTLRGEISLVYNTVHQIQKILVTVSISFFSLGHSLQVIALSIACRVAGNFDGGQYRKVIGPRQY